MADDRSIAFDRAGMGSDRDHITRVQLADITFDWKRAGILRGVEKDRCDFSAENHAPSAFVWHVGNVIPRMPQNGVNRTFSRAACPHHIADVGHGMAVLLQLCNGVEPVGVSRLQHRQSM